MHYHVSLVVVVIIPRLMPMLTVRTDCIAMDEDGSEMVVKSISPPASPNIPPDVKVEQVEPSKRSIIIRPGIGTSGRPISLLANHFRVSVRNPDEIFYQYSVKIQNHNLFKFTPSGMNTY